jgi:hypothetical protein
VSQGGGSQVGWEEALQQDRRKVLRAGMPETRAQVLLSCYSLAV